MKQWKRLAALSSAIVMAMATLTYFPSDTLQNIRWEISASAETTTVSQVWIEGNLTWTLYEDGTLTISGTGAMKSYRNDDSPAVQKKDNVKKVVIEDGVTSIGASAFYSCKSLTSITIPDSVTSIGFTAFYACSSLTSITIPGSVTSMERSAFEFCTGLKSVTISDGVTSIGESAFINCYSLTSITIPDSVTSIENYAFANCSNLTSITIPKSVTSIGNSAFKNCSSLTSIMIPKSVTSIGKNAFKDCYNLTVYLESGSTLTSNDLGVDESKIVSYWNEDNLTWKLTADGTLTISGTGAMKKYNSNYNPSPACGNSSVKKVVIEDGVTSIGGTAFQYCSSLSSITIPNSVTSIGSYAFGTCRSLTSITIPDSVTSIGDYAFKNCSSLKTIFLSCNPTLKKSDFGNQADLVSVSHTLKKTEAKAATCTENGNKAYWTCEHCGKYFLSDDANPETAKAVEQSEFITPALNHKNAYIRDISKPTETAPGYTGDRYCPDCDTVLEKGYTYWNEGNLTWKLDADGTMTISGTGTMKNYNRNSPVYMNSKVKKVVIENGVTSIGNFAFYNCTSLTSITIPDSVTSIGEDAFSYCTSLTSITIPNSVTSIGNYAFSYCGGLISITIPDSVTSIGEWAFKECTSLTSITISSSVTSIGAYAFAGCTSLTSITIPDSVTSIKAYAAFNGCTSLKTISMSCGSTLKRSDFIDQANLVSYTSHILTKTAAKAVTCTENGNKEYWTCEHCKKYFLSNDTNPETAKAVEQSEFIIPASHKLTKVEAKDATCAENGNKAYWTCEHCGKYFLSDDTNPETAKAVEQSETIIRCIRTDRNKPWLFRRLVLSGLRYRCGKRLYLLDRR